jgi:WD40 repeat protein
MSSANQTEWDVFISYRRSDGTPIARRVRIELEKFTFPANHPSPGRKHCRVYLDTSYGQSTDDFYEKNIRPALLSSRFLLVILTPSVFEPNKDGSENWVIRELRDFLTANGSQRVLVARGRGGDLRSPLPAPLTHLPNIQITDLRSVASSELIRWWRRWKIREAISEVIPPIFESDPKFLPLIRQENERQRSRSRGILAVLSASIAIIFAGLAMYAFLQAGIAEHQRVLALARQLAAQAELTAKSRGGPKASLNMATEAMKLLVEIKERSLDVDVALRNALARLPLPVSWFPALKHASAMSFSGNGKFLGVAAEGKISLWDMDAGSRVTEIPGKLFAFSDDNNLFAVVDSGRIDVMSLGAGPPKPVFYFFGDGNVSGIAFSKDGRYLYSWDAYSHQLDWQIPPKPWNNSQSKNYSEEISVHATNEQGDQNKFEKSGRYVTFWTFLGGPKHAAGIVRARGQVDFVSTSDDELTWLTATNPVGTRIGPVGEAAVQIWTPPGDEIACLEISTQAARLNGDGRYFATIDTNENAQLWELRNGGEASISLITHRADREAVWRPALHAYPAPEPVKGINYNIQSVLASSGDHRFVLVQARGKGVIAKPPDEVAIYDAQLGKVKCPLRHTNPVIHAAFSYDGELLATAAWSRDYYKGISVDPIRVWETCTCNQAYEILQAEPILLLEFSPDKNYLVGVGGETGDAPGVMTGFDMELRSDSTHQVQIWDALNGKPVGRISCRRPIRAVFFDTEETGSYLVTAGTEDKFTWWVLDQSALLKEATLRSGLYEASNR